MVYRDDPAHFECGDDGVTERHSLGNDGVKKNNLDIYS
jgi:hypothetical protein